MMLPTCLPIRPTKGRPRLVLSEPHATVHVVTPRGAGGVAVLVGEGSGRAALLRLFASVRTDADYSIPRRVVLRDPRDGQALDDGLAMDHPSTGALEVHCHGSQAVLLAVEAALRDQGVLLRDAELEDMAVKLVCTARDPAGLAMALEQQNLRRVGAPCPACLQLLGASQELEAKPTTFTHGACPAFAETRAARLRRQTSEAGLEEELESMAEAFLARSRVARSHAEPCPLVLCGMQNAGKSTLLNRLLFDERALASAVPGTTRDAVIEEAALGGYLYSIHDTAGLGPVQSEVDARAQVRSRELLDRWSRAKSEAVVVLLVDRAVGPSDVDREIIASFGARNDVGVQDDGSFEGPHLLVCATKGDLLAADWPADLADPDLVLRALEADAAETLRSTVGDVLRRLRGLPVAGPVGGCAALSAEEWHEHDARRG